MTSSHRTTPPPRAAIRRNLNQGLPYFLHERFLVSVASQVSLYCSARELPPRDFSHRLISYSQAGEQSSSRQLDELFERIQQSTHEITPQLFALLRQLERTRHFLVLELAPHVSPTLESWLERSLGLLRRSNGELVDHGGRTLYSPDGQSDPQAELPRPLEARQRRERTQTRLKSQGLSVPEHLPLVISEREIHLRETREVAERCLALFLVALRGDSAGAGEPIPTEELKQMRPLGFAHLTPEEQDYLNHPHPDAHVVFSWRYESLLALLWSAGLQELPPPSELCDVSAVVGMMLDCGEEQILTRANQRAPSILLDALDLTFCQLWLVRQAQLDNNKAPDEIDLGIVYERYYALSWLTRFEPYEWDDICTPT